MKNLTVSVLLLLVFTTGCSSTSWTKSKWYKPDMSSLLPAGPPVKSLAAWEPAVRHSGLEKPERGFGGRVYFYDDGGTKPIKVKGCVVVYAFDEENRKHDDNAPTRSYFFAKDDVKKLYSKSKLGHSYNFWIPWDSEGPDGKSKKVSLIVRYVPDKGSSVVSSQAVVYLPGKAGQTEMLAKEEWNKRQEQLAVWNVRHLVNGIMQTSHSEEQISEFKPIEAYKQTSLQERLLEENGNRPQMMKTATIAIPASVNTSLTAEQPREMIKDRSGETERVHAVKESVVSPQR
ncbi:MAG: hypothetical protein FWE67_08985 [Planctomycetaceae bacterium]|nr:hypothetical protein [Planctomycetaceae bacterium]